MIEKVHWAKGIALVGMSPYASLSQCHNRNLVDPNTKYKRYRVSQSQSIHQSSQEHGAESIIGPLSVKNAPGVIG